MILKEFFSHANWLAIIVATVAYFVLGALWYSKILFAKPWMAGHNIMMTDAQMAEAKKRFPLMMASTLVLNFVIVLAVALLAFALQSTQCLSGIKLGLLLSGAFSAAVIVINYMYTGKSFKLMVIDAGYHVVGITLASIIVSIWHMHH